MNIFYNKFSFKKKFKMMSNIDKKKPTNIYYVSQKKDTKEWVVKRGNAEKASAVLKTKVEAVDKAKEFAKNSSATIIVRKMDGSIQETISYKNKK